MVSSTDPTFPLFPVFAFIGFVVSLIPLPWHIGAWNSGTCAYMIWVALACLISFVNALVWAGNVNNPAPVWCDISSKILLGVRVGIPASILCISRRLYYITSSRTVSITRDDKRRMVIIDLCLAVGAPVVIMVLHYIVQGHRFDILEDIGCFPVIYNTLPAYFIFFMWPVAFGAVSFVFSALTLRSFWIRRLQFSQLVASNSPMTMSKYLRLVFLALIDILCTLPIGVFSIYLGSKGVTLAPWISWSDTHFNFSRVDLVPASFWRSDPSFKSSVELGLWLPVVCAFIFFALFGFADEAHKNYRWAFWAVMKIFGVRPPPPEKKQKSTPFHEGGYPWTKPTLKSVNLSSSPGMVTRVPLSPTSSSNPSQKLGRATSFSTSASTHFGSGDLELEPYKPMPIHADIEKLAGLHSSLTTDADTIYGTPPTYYSPYSKSTAATASGFFPDVPQSTSTWSATTTMRLMDVTPPPSPGSSATNLNLQHLPPPPRKPSSSSISVPVTSSEAPELVADSTNDRIYISPVPKSATRLNGRAQSPSSPPPFADTMDLSRGPDSELSQIHNTVQVIVLKTETTTSEMA